MSYLGLLGLLLLAGCQVETAACSQAPAIVGTWRYSATESTPVRAMVSGTLSITSASCAAIVGSMDVVQTSASGAVQRLAGPVTGQAINGTSFQFNAFLEATPRQHLATVIGDSLSGSWVNNTGTQAATGTFAARRE